jgi:hypothetical protein
MSQPRVAIYVEGGQIQYIFADSSVSVFVLDDNNAGTVMNKDDRDYTYFYVEILSKDKFENRVEEHEKEMQERYPDNLYQESNQDEHERI